MPSTLFVAEAQARLETHRYPGETEEAHPEIFTKIPPPVAEKKPGQLSSEQIREFFEEGFVYIPDYYTPSDLDPARDAVASLLDDFAQKLFNAGKITSLYTDRDLFTRMCAIEKEFPGAAVCLHKQGKLPEAFRHLWCNERILNAVEQLLDTANIAGHPVWNLRVKTPNNPEATVPWHQDVAYRVLTVSAWIPLLDVDESNGCLQFYRGGHRTGKVARHTCCAGPTWYLMADEAELRDRLGIDLERDIRTIPVKYGGVILFNNLVPHQSTENRSNVTRWSLDLRYFDPRQPTGFYGLKDPVVFRREAGGDVVVDWDSFCAVDRTEAQSLAVDRVDSSLEPVISGPWMSRWQLVHANKHTAALNPGARFDIVSG